MENNFKDASLYGYKDLTVFSKSLIPFFIRNQYPNFVKFIQIFLKKYSDKGSGAEFIHNMLYYANIDETSAEFVDKFCQQYLRDLNYIDKINRRTLVKWIRQWYEAIGSEQSYKFLFRVLYNKDVKFYYPTVDIARVSNGKWIKDKIIRIQRSMLRDEDKKYYEDLVGTEIEGIGLSPEGWNSVKNQPSGAKALVEKVNFISMSVDHDNNYKTLEKDYNIVELLVTDYSHEHPLKDLKTNEYIKLTCLHEKDLNGDPITWFEKTYSIVNGLKLIENTAGQFFQYGDEIHIMHPKGFEAHAIVNNVTSGEIIGIEVIKPGKGYKVGEKIIVQDGHGLGAYGYITEILPIGNEEEAEKARMARLKELGDKSAAKYARDVILFDTGDKDAAQVQYDMVMLSTCDKQEAQRVYQEVYDSTEVREQGEIAYTEAKDAAIEKYREEYRKKINEKYFIYTCNNKTCNHVFGNFQNDQILDNLKLDVQKCPECNFSIIYSSEENNDPAFGPVKRKISTSTSEGLEILNNFLEDIGDKKGDLAKRRKMHELSLPNYKKSVYATGNRAKAIEAYNNKLKETGDKEFANEIYEKTLLESALKDPSVVDAAESEYRRVLYESGGIRKVILGSHGEGYREFPKITILTSNGSGALLYPHCYNVGKVSQVKIINPGFDYTNIEWSEVDRCFNDTQTTKTSYVPSILENRSIMIVNKLPDLPSDPSNISNIAYLVKTDIIDNYTAWMQVLRGENRDQIAWRIIAEDVTSKGLKTKNVSNVPVPRDIIYDENGIKTNVLYNTTNDLEKDPTSGFLFPENAMSTSERTLIKYRGSTEFKSLPEESQHVLETAVDINKCYTFPIKLSKQSYSQMAITDYVVTFYRKNPYSSPNLVPYELVQIYDSYTTQMIQGRILRVDNERGIMCVKMLSNDIFIPGMVVQGSDSKSKGNVIMAVYVSEFNIDIGSSAETVGYYANTDGWISSDKRIQDSYFYQDFSYVLNVDVKQKEWADIIDSNVHPAGTIAFGIGSKEIKQYGPSCGGKYQKPNQEQTGSMCRIYQRKGSEKQLTQISTNY